MNIRWQKLLVKICFWLATEIVLNLIGIDDLADYSEFIFEHKNLTTNLGCISIVSMI